jgi:RNA polymerase sigma-70 factor (ECF subfamily)
MIQDVLFMTGLALKSGPTASTSHPVQSHAMDEAAFEEFYQETARPLWSYIYRVSGNATLSDDLLQDAYCRFLRASISELDRAQMKAYLYKIATNLIRDHWRQTKRESGLSVNAEALEKVSTGDAGLGLDMTRVFQKLKPQDQTLLWLAYVEGSEHREIARALDIKEKSVRVLLFRARKRLAGLLNPQASDASKGR